MPHLEALSRKISLAVMRESDCGAKVEAEGSMDELAAGR